MVLCFFGGDEGSYPTGRSTSTRPSPPSKKAKAPSYDGTFPFLVGLSETFSKNYKIIRDYVKHHASTPVKSGIEQCTNNTPYNPNCIVKTIKQQQKTLTEFEIQSVIQKYQNGASSYDLAKEFGCHRRTISDTLKRNGVEVSHQAATKPELVKRIIELYAEMKTPKEVGAIVGVGGDTVRKVLKENGIYIRKSREYPKGTK